MTDGSTYDAEALWLSELAPKLLRSEYPDQMAAASCSCEPEAVCGAHRLLARYDELYKHLVATNERHRKQIAALRLDHQNRETK